MKKHPKKLFLLLPLLVIVILSGCLQKKFLTSQSLAKTWTEISGGIYDLTSRIGKHGMDPKKWEWLKQFEIKM